MLRCISVVTGITLAAGAWALAQDLPDPAAFRQQAMQNPNIVERFDGEQFAWHARNPAEDLVRGYEGTGDTRWLEEAVIYIDFLIEQLREDPDGYKGWIGQTIWGVTGRAEHDQYRSDALVGDAILLIPIVRFAEIVLKDEQLREQFGDKAREYADLARHIGWEKWNHRGTYYRDAAGYGSYRMDDRFIDAETWQWVPRPPGSEARSDNLNKHSAMAIVLLRLWRIDGNDEYRQRVEEVFGRLKNMFRHWPEDDRISWNFWMPHGPYDVQGGRLASWVAVHPRSASYQASEVGRMVEVYDSGLVFDRDDMQRLVNTNLWMMPRDGGEWRSSDGSTDAGQLWSSLARFNEQIMQRHEESLRRGSGDRNQVSRAYFDAVTKHLGWDRAHVSDPAEIRVYDHPPQPGRDLSMSVVIPDHISLADGGEARLVTQTRSAGTLRIELLDRQSGQVLGELHRQDVGDTAQNLLPAWDGTNPRTGRREAGEYIVRWTFRDDVRTQPVWVDQAPRTEAADAAAPQRAPLARPQSGVEPITQGQSLRYDFTGELDPRWQLEGGASVVADRARSGDRSLKLETGQSATLRFGEDEPLPVRITMWVYDGGGQFGEGNVNGPAWGVRTADGEFFGVAQFWRRYLDGNNFYAWINTADNDWYAPKHSNVRRSTGWNQWVFDFTRTPATVQRDRSPVRLQPELTPRGAVAIYLRGGDVRGGPLFVDDIVVEYR